MTQQGRESTPKIVTLCGSMRFFPQILQTAADETAKGHIVLASFSVIAPEDQGSTFKEMLDRLHFQKIDMSAEIIVVTDQNGYVGESTRREMAYALSTDKGIGVRERHIPADGDGPIDAGHRKKVA